MSIREFANSISGEWRLSQTPALRSDDTHGAHLPTQTSRGLRHLLHRRAKQVLPCIINRTELSHFTRTHITVALQIRRGKNFAGGARVIKPQVCPNAIQVFNQPENKQPAAKGWLLVFRQLFSPIHHSLIPIIGLDMIGHRSTQVFLRSVNRRALSSKRGNEFGGASETLTRNPSRCEHSCAICSTMACGLSPVTSNFTSNSSIASTR